MISENITRALRLLDGITSGDLMAMGKRASVAVSESLGALRLEVSNERPRGWIPARFNITLRDPDGTCEVDGMKHVPALLGIHITVSGTADVTHIPTGKRLGSFGSLGAAVEFVEVVKDLYAWHEPTLNVPLTTERLIQAAISAHQQRAFAPRQIR